MDEDVDMDAPQISTLREEVTPPPPQRTGIRVKLVVGKKNAGPTVTVPSKRSHTEDEDDEDEDQEDQLIDDDDDVSAKPSKAPARPVETTPKRKAPVKRKSKKIEKKGSEEKQEKPVPLPPPPSLPEEGFDPNHISLTVAPPVEPASAPPKGMKKKPAAKKAPAKPKATKPPKVKNVLPQLADDAGVLSEGGFTGTAASSPVTTHFANSPDPELGDAPGEEINIEALLLPVYPLPTKPFPVQPPPKISSGFAPVMPLDRSGKKVRLWRVANREIRGIAGGRWFAHAWVGEKDSEYAGSKASEGSLTIPKLPAVLSASGKGKGKVNKALSLTGTSRSGSLVPEGPTIPGVRNLTKMRNSMQFPPPPSSEAGDSDMMGPG
ncbi:uncharacterized protein BT62DRAFT_926299 [Guyanagaster necrorhizus]|uniref:Uncharacterized protein n=1 Tax=Guyanagaster necrorhizus TaxID=856835 RepID=A0A9P7W532_9AGAR|nr:uncharacterized protein BT62DRAFT_926299 [Guyanagaster necrorhizus MCA 3950]KAG7452085.1 hypothetical protein BT62DRAFT_926299 [Guyanagaster necrorhizus MCA 3950]